MTRPTPPTPLFRGWGGIRRVFSVFSGDFDSALSPLSDSMARLNKLENPVILRVEHLFLDCPHFRNEKSFLRKTAVIKCTLTSQIRPMHILNWSQQLAIRTMPSKATEKEGSHAKLQRSRCEQQQALLPLCRSSGWGEGKRVLPPPRSHTWA